jgi:hypothetical protein
VTWPNFFVIGAQKAGTTSLYHYLRQHPDVFMSAEKEPGYFKSLPTAPPKLVLPGERKIADLDEYLRLFDGVGAERAIGEATASYLSNAAAVERIHEAVPHAKLIAVLRNPVERAFSAYSMRVSQGVEDASFAEAVLREREGRRAGSESPKWRYVGPGFYGRQLSRYLQRFDREQLSVHLFEDLSRDPQRLMHDVFEFLGVDGSFVPTIADHNVTRYAVKSQRMNRLVSRVPGKSLVRRVVPSDVWARARRSVRRRNSRMPEFAMELRRDLVELYRDDIRLTEELIGRDLSAWTVLERAPA